MWYIGLTIFFLGLIALLQGDVAVARPRLEEGLVLFKEMWSGDVVLKFLLAWGLAQVPLLL